MKVPRKILSIFLVLIFVVESAITYVEARDFKLAYIYLMDAIEDMEYAERESVYIEEHLSFLAEDEKNTEDSGILDSESIDQESTLPSDENTEDLEINPTNYEDEELEEDIENENIATQSEIDENTEDLKDEEESDSENVLNDIANTSEISNNDEDEENAIIENTDLIATQPNIDIILDNIEIATLSELHILEETNLFGTGPLGAGQELFTLPISSSQFSLKAVTKKSVRGGQTCVGVMVCGLMQTPSATTGTDTFSSTICNHQDRHEAVFKLYKERLDPDDPSDTEDIYVGTTITTTPTLSMQYPDYSGYGTYTENKTYNLQTSIIGVNSPLQVDTFYHITEKASGCAGYTTEEVDLPDDYVGPPVKPIGKHTGGKVYDHSMENNIDDSFFVLYKVKYGDNFERIAAYYGYDDVSELANDNHMIPQGASQKYMCYEGDILFIRYPDIEVINKPFENNLSPLELAAFKAVDFLLGYEAAQCAFYGEPINMSTGDFYLEHTDFTIPELDKEFKFSRSYNSIGSIIRSDFGYGFNSIVNDRLMVESGGTVMHFRADGGGETYRTNRDGTYTANSGHNILKAVKDESGSSYDDYDDSGDTTDLPEDDEGLSVGGANYWMLYYEDGSIAKYSGYGTLLSKTDKKGLTYTYSYDNKYRVTSITLPSGVSVRFTYNSDNLINKVTLPDGTFITYEYDSYKNLIKVKDAENRETTYKYDDNGVDPAKHLMTSWYDADNIRQVLNTYDSSNRVIKQIDGNGNESTIRYESSRTVVTDNEGNEIIYNLDEKKRTKEQLFGASATESEYSKSFSELGKINTEVDGNGVTTTYTYDANGNVLIEEKSDGTYTISKSYTYDSYNNKTSETDYNGNTTTFEYDARNNLTKITDALGNTEEMTYDSLSRLISKKDKKGNITRYRYTGNNPKPSEIEDAKHNITSFTYDGMRRQTSETDALGNVSSIEYDNTGRKLKEKDKRGNETTYTYSARGVVSSIKDREDNVSTFTYDNVGNILSGTDGESNTLTYEYDKNYNKILEKNLPNLTKMVYNDKGQVIEEIDALNNSKTYTLDGIGNIIKEIDRNGNEINYRYNNVLNKIIEKTDGNGKITRYDYDNNGNLLKETKPDNSEINYEYDALNQLIKVTNEAGTETNFIYDANGNIIKKEIDDRATEYTYDVVDNLTEEKSPLGYVNKLEYDAIGNIVKLTDENNYTIEYTYDENSNITKIKDAENHIEEYTYNKENKKLTYKDKNGNITRFTYDRAGRVVEKINALNEKEKLEYDSNDNIIKNIIYNSDGSIFSETNRTYNALNKLIEEVDAENYTTTYTYDNNENITSITNKNGDTKIFTYDASNNVIKSVDEMGLTTEYEYDDNYNIIKVSDNSDSTLDTNGAIVGGKQSSGLFSTASPIELREYDRLGNLTKLTDAIGREEVYEYNIFGEQIKKVEKDGATTNYTYDKNGNLIKIVRPDSQELLYTYDKHNKLIKTKLNDVVYEYTYDKNYNIVEEKNPLGNIATYTYDNNGNVVEVKDEENNITKNEYDSLDRMVKQTDARNNNVELKYDRNNNIIEVKTAENIVNKYEYDKERRLIKEIDGENHFIEYEYDGLGNILKKTTESNEITTYTYDKHNVMTSMTDSLNNTETYETNLNKQVLKKIQKDGTIYKYNYDRAKRLTSTIDPMNYRINFTYSDGDDIIKTTDTLGRQVNYEYDILHNLTKQTVGTSGSVGASTASPLTTELWDYDTYGNVIRHIDKREKIEKFTYDLTDNLISHKDKNGNTTNYTYDRVGNIKEVKEPNGAKTLYDYDANYNRIRVTNPRGKSANYTFDRDNRLISETDPNGNTKTYNYNNNNNLSKITTALGNIQKYEYDTDNNLIKEIDPRNKTKNYTYDKLNRLTKTTSELNNTAIFTYDIVDNVKGIKDPKGTNTVFDYNDVGKVVQERSIDNTIRTYNYDRAGRLISKINKDQSKIAYDYDANDNLIKKYYLDLHNQQTDDSIVYSYNGENQRLGMNDKSGLSRTLYDNNGNLIFSTSNSDKDIVKYDYDENDRLIKITYPTHAKVRYTYDANGNIKTVIDKDGLKTTYTYDDNDNEVIRTTGLIETNKRYDADNRLIRIKNEHRFTGELIDEYSYRYDANNNIIEEIKREPYKKKVSLLDIDAIEETDRTIRVTKQTFTYDDENKLIDARVERLGMKVLSEPSVTTYHYEYDENGNRTLVDIKDDGLTLESTVYTYDRLNRMVRSREVTANGLYIYEYSYDINGNLISEDRHRSYELNTNQYTNIRRYEYTKDNKLEAVYSGNTLLVAYTYDGDGLITSSLDRDLDLNQNLNINDRAYLNSLTQNQRQLINKVSTTDSILYELTEYVTDRNQTYTQTLMERDGTGQLSTIYTYGNQRINSESYNNLTGIYTYDGRGSVSAVIGGYGDFRATYWYDGLGNVKSQTHGYGAFGSGKKYYGYNAEQYNPVTGNQNLRARQVNIRRQRFLSEDTYIGNKTDTLSINRYIYARNNPLKYLDPSGYGYVYAIWLLNENGAQAWKLPIYAGHAALILAEDNGQGEFYSYVGDNTRVNEAALGTNLDGYLTTVVDRYGEASKFDLNAFFTGDGYKDNIGVINKIDTIGNPNSFAVFNNETGKYSFSKDKYTYGILIPITNQEGVAMHNEALAIRANPSYYNLYYHNCNQVVQQILSMGGKNFDSSEGFDLNTMPNIVRNQIVNAINIYTFNQTIDYTKYKDWKYGTIEELSRYIIGCYK